MHWTELKLTNFAYHNIMHSLSKNPEDPMHGLLDMLNSNSAFYIRNNMYKKINKLSQNIFFPLKIWLHLRSYRVYNNLYLHPPQLNLLHVLVQFGMGYESEKGNGAW